MSVPEARRRSGITATSFETPSKLDIKGDNGEIVDLLTHLRGRNGYRAPDVTQGVDLATARINKFLLPSWGEPSTPRPLNERTVQIYGMDVAGDSIFEDAEDVDVVSSFVHGQRNVITNAARPNVRSSVLAGDSVLGAPINENPPTFSREGLGIMLDLVVGITQNNEDVVRKNLGELTKALTPHELTWHTTDPEGAYAGFGDLKPAAIIFDFKYLPWIQAATNNVLVTDSMITARNAVGTGILGGSITDSVISTDRVLEHAHVRVRNTTIFTDSGEEYIETGTRGDPSRAEALVDAVKELPNPKGPLLAFAA